MASINDQFEHGRIPLKPLAYKNHELSQDNEIMIDYEKHEDGTDPKYHIYITDNSHPDKYIDITKLIIEEMLPEYEIDASQYTVVVGGVNNDVEFTLQDIINYIYKRFTHAKDQGGFSYNLHGDKLSDPTTKSILLQTADGTAQLPVTLASNVYDDTGNSIQARLDNMTRLGFSVTYLRNEEVETNEFIFDYPFEDYSDMLEVRIGTTYISKDRYTIEPQIFEGHYTKGKLILKESVEAGRRIDLIWVFNSVYTATNEDYKGSKLNFMSGSRIANNTIPITKLERVSSSYKCSDSGSLATSKALYDLYEYFNTRVVTSAGQNLFYCNDTNTNSYENITAIINKEPKTDDIVVVTMSDNKYSTATLNIGMNKYSIVTPDLSSITRGFRNNQAVVFKLDNENNNAIVLSGATGITTNKYWYDCEDQEVEISFSDLHYSSGDIINVYRNGVRLFQDIDYSIDYIKNTITLYVRTEQGERIVFEALGI